MRENRVAVVLVTFNRLDKLKIALDCYEKQTYPLAEIVVIDNCSTDGTDTFLKEWEAEKGKFKKKVITLSENTGGAGGFGIGMDEVLDQVNNNQLNVDWVMVSDDDAFPLPNAIEQLIEFYNNRSVDEQNDISALSSQVLNQGKPHLAHRSRIEKNIFRVRFVGVSEKEYKNEFFEIDLFSYVGSMIKVHALQKAGTTNKNLFIYGDDNEHSFRLKNYGKILCIPASIYNHDTPGVETRKVGWYNYYNRRNQLYILKKYFPRRYLMMRVIKRYILDISIFSKHSREEIKLFKTAQNDALSERLGKHPVYKPGFQIKEG